MLCHHGCDNRSDKSCARAKQASRFFTRRSTSTAAIGGDTGHIVHRQHWPWHRGISFFNHSVTARVIWVLSHPWSARLIHVAWQSQCCHWIGYQCISIHSRQPRHQVFPPASTTHIQPVSQLSNQHQQDTCNCNDTQRTSCPSLMLPGRWDLHARWNYCSESRLLVEDSPGVLFTVHMIDRHCLHHRTLHDASMCSFHAASHRRVFVWG